MWTAGAAPNCTIFALKLHRLPGARLKLGCELEGIFPIFSIKVQCFFSVSAVVFMKFWDCIFVTADGIRELKEAEGYSPIRGCALRPASFRAT